MKAGTPIVAMDVGTSLQWVVSIDDFSIIRVWSLDWDIKLEGLDSSELEVTGWWTAIR